MLQKTFDLIEVILQAIIAPVSIAASVLAFINSDIWIGIAYLLMGIVWGALAVLDGLYYWCFYKLPDNAFNTTNKN